mgnify:CR=1 FL=1
MFIVCCFLHFSGDDFSGYKSGFSVEILYSCCCGSYRRNTSIHRQRWKDNICKRAGLQFTIICQPYFNIAETLRSDCSVILWSADMLFIFRQLKPKKGTLQKKLTGNSLHCHLLKKSLFSFAFDRSIDLLVKAL